MKKRVFQKITKSIVGANKLSKSNLACQSAKSTSSIQESMQNKNRQQNIFSQNDLLTLLLVSVELAEKQDENVLSRAHLKLQNRQIL